MVVNSPPCYTKSPRAREEGRLLPFKNSSRYVPVYLVIKPFWFQHGHGIHTLWCRISFFFSFQKNALMGEFWVGMKQGKQVITCLNWVEKGSGLKWIDRFKVDQAYKEHKPLSPQENYSLPRC